MRSYFDFTLPKYWKSLFWGYGGIPATVDVWEIGAWIKAGAHESYVLSKMSFVTIGVSQLLSCAGDFGKILVIHDM